MTTHQIQLAEAIISSYKSGDYAEGDRLNKELLMDCIGNEYQRLRNLKVGDKLFWVVVPEIRELTITKIGTYSGETDHFYVEGITPEGDEYDCFSFDVKGWCHGDLVFQDYQSALQGAIKVAKDRVVVAQSELDTILSLSLT
jgi:hypothetical protein